MYKHRNNTDVVFKAMIVTPINDISKFLILAKWYNIVNGSPWAIGVGVIEDICINYKDVDNWSEYE